jgi:Flp pilus assembly pilin Flp
LVYLAYTNFIKLATPQITVQALIASLLVGIIAVVLIVAAVVLVVDGLKAFRRYGAQQQAKAA